MANKYRGEAEIEIDGKTRQLQIGSRVICKAEAALGKSLNQIIGDIDQARLTTLVSLFRCALVQKETLSEDEAYELVDQIGYQKIGAALTVALLGALGIEREAKEGSANPTDASS